MTNKIAIWLGILLIGAIAIDVFLSGPVHLVFLGKKFFELLDWVAFWR
ncbi:hypothetical protein RSK20926_19782 [Roseobacter sp. SK209-2-6]|nr:hypothetical protein [Roseobacter sp. SK209-2-6]EBA18013.1 hypothetical protein RSK20926_19782 [Roseobacter sp. SK209-2-6]